MAGQLPCPRRGLALVRLLLVSGSLRLVSAVRDPLEASAVRDPGQDVSAVELRGSMRRTAGDVTAHSGEAQEEAEVCPGLAERSSCAAVGDRKAVLLAVTGLRKRLIFDSTVEHVVRSLAGDGHAVHVYMSLIDKPDDHPWKNFRLLEKEVPEHANKTHREMREHLSGMVERAGGCLMCYSVEDHSEALPQIPEALDQQLYTYKPRDTAVGGNVLRVWKARQALWGFGLRAEKQLGMTYSLAMWSRDDTRWVSRLMDVRSLLEAPDAANSVWSKNCRRWGGINDKVVLSGRAAAEKMFGAYDAFFDEHKHIRSANAEKYLARMAGAKGLKMKELSFAQMPSGDAMYVEKPTPYCFVRMYWCGSDEEVQKDKSSFCPEE